MAYDRYHFPVAIIGEYKYKYKENHLYFDTQEKQDGPLAKQMIHGRS